MPRKPKALTAPASASAPASAPTMPATMPLGPYVAREANVDGPARVVVLPSGLALIEALAGDGAPQSKLAADLGIGLTKFKALLADDDGESPVRMAWEAGRASLEHEVSHLLLTAARKGNVIAAIYYSKAQLGWTEQPQVNAQVGVQIVLPDSSPDHESYMRRIADRGIAVNVVANTETPAPAVAPPVPTLTRRATR